MTNTAIILPGQGKSISLHTAKGNSIENEQSGAMTPEEEYWDRKFAERHLTAKPRSKMSGRYNCHGLVFASRRTRIYAHSELMKIFADDEYSDVPLPNVLEGDIILYLEEGEIIHSGIVIDPPRAENCWNPLVFSKWGNGREFIHRANDCPYVYNVQYKRIGYVDAIKSP